MFDEKAANRNARLMILEGTIFWAGLSFLQGDTVITNFIRLTTGSAALAGFASTTKTLSWLLGQFILGLFTHKFRSQSRLMAVVGFASRPLILLMTLIMVLNVPGEVSAWLFLLLYALFFLADGMLTLCWLSICTRTLPIARRGDLDPADLRRYRGAGRGLGAQDASGQRSYFSDAVRGDLLAGGRADGTGQRGAVAD